MKALWTLFLMFTLACITIGSVGATPLNPSLNRDQLRDQDGQSLAEKIRLASRAYLQLDGLEAERLIKEALDLIQMNPPYLGLRSDLAQIASLNVVLKEEQSTVMLQIDPFPFRLDEAFQKNLSDRIRDSWAKQSRPSVEVAQLNEFSGIRISGEVPRLPTRLSEGDYLAHASKDGKHFGGWLHVSNERGIHFERVFEIPSQLIVDDKASKIGARITTKTQSAQLNGWLQTELEKSKSPLVIDPTALDLRNEESLEPKSSFYQKPWFWIAVGLASGLGGFATYQALRSPTVVQLP